MKFLTLIFPVEMGFNLSIVTLAKFPQFFKINNAPKLVLLLSGLHVCNRLTLNY
jgi:hypothetical protein